MRSIRMLGMCLTASACASRPAVVSRAADLPAPSSSMGQHAFRAELPGGTQFTGTLIVTEDTIVPRPSEGECRTAAGTNRQSYVYTCTVPGTPELMLALDRTNPLRRSTWGLSTLVRKTRQKCTDYRTWENGTRTCTRSQPEEYFDTVPVKGPLQITPP